MTGAKRSALEGLAVLDLSETISGQFATRLMADNGAMVALVEPSSGSALRRHPPLRSGTDNESLLFWHLNGGKRSVVLDFDRDALVDACGRADVVVVGDRAVADLITAECPRAVVGLTSEFGDEGPYASWAGCELVYQALSGSMFVTGNASREPLYGVGHRASYGAGVWLYIGLLSALRSRRSGGSMPRVVEVTNHEAAAAMEENFSTQWQYSKTLAHRGLANGRAVWSLQCSDGWVVLFARTGQWSTICDFLGAPDLADEPRFSTWAGVLDNHSQAGSALQKHIRRLTVTDLLDLADRHGVVADEVLDGSALRDELHLRHRRYWQEVSTPGGERVNLGPVFRLSEAPTIRDQPPPPIGNQVRAPESATPRADPTPGKGDGNNPLDGIVVLEVTTAWAGPMCTRVLATLGAEVIKVEGPGKYDSWRGQLSPTRLELYPNREPGDRPYDRCAQFNTQNLGKSAIVLDLKQEKGRDILLDLSSEADVVVTNLRPGAMVGLGLGYDDFRRRNDSIIFVEMPALGDGPLSHKIGLGPTMEARTGITDLIGYRNGAPIGSGSSYLDPMGAVHAAAAALTALYQRDSDGQGQHVEVAQRDAAMHWIGEFLLDAIENHHWRPRGGNELESASPHNAFPARGDDEWVAIAVFTDEQWTALCEVLFGYGDPAEATFATVESRLSRTAEVETLVARATTSWGKRELTAKLQRAGVPAAPILNGKDLLEDPHLAVRGWFSRLEHSAVNRYEYPGLPLLFDGNRPRAKRSSPTFGQDTAAVLARYLGLGDGDIAEFTATRVTSEAPLSL